MVYGCENTRNNEIYLITLRTILQEDDRTQSFISYTTRSKRVKKHVKKHVKTSQFSHSFHMIFTTFHTHFTCLFHMRVKYWHVKSIWRVCENHVKNVWRMLSFSHAFSHAISHTISHIFFLIHYQKQTCENHVKTSQFSHNFHMILTTFHTLFTCLFHMRDFSHAYFTCVWNMKGRELCAIPLQRGPGQTRVDQGQSLAWKLDCSRALAISGWLRDQKKRPGGNCRPWQGSIKMWEIGQLGESKTTLVSLAIY